MTGKIQGHADEKTNCAPPNTHENSSTFQKETIMVKPTFHIPANVHPALELAHKFVKDIPDAIIAGGAARDLILESEIKDVDIFIPACETVYSIARRVMQIAGAAHKLGLNDMELYDTECDNRSYLRICANPLDIVISKLFYSAGTLVDNFDFVMCQAWLEIDGDGFSVKCTDAFTQHHKRKLLAYYASRQGYSSDRLERMKYKFPDFLPLALEEPKVSVEEREGPYLPGSDDDFPF